MKKFELRRCAVKSGACIGLLTQVEGLLVLPTLENAKNRVPAGTYTALRDHTGKHKWWVILGSSVSRWPEPWADWSSVEFHPGNTLEDTDACPLVGTAFVEMDEAIAVANSRTALGHLYEEVGDESWILEIIEIAL